MFHTKNLCTTYWFFVKKYNFSLKKSDLQRDIECCHDNTHLPNKMIFYKPLGHIILNIPTKFRDFWIIKKKDIRYIVGQAHYAPP